MMWRSAAGAALLLLLAVSAPPIPIAGASSSGPPPAKTGGFGEMTCRECHWENPLNDPSGAMLLSGIPEAYTPGEAYLITMKVAHPDTKRAGFQLSARADGQENPGSAAGVLRATDRLTRVVINNGIAYISQTEDGSKAVAGQAGSWTFEWTAPTSGATVRFHAAGNAANGDASPLGDFIYTTTLQTQPRK